MCIRMYDKRMIKDTEKNLKVMLLSFKIFEKEER